MAGYGEDEGEGGGSLLGYLVLIAIMFGSCGLCIKKYQQYTQKYQQYPCIYLEPPPSLLEVRSAIIYKEELEQTEEARGRIKRNDFITYESIKLLSLDRANKIIEKYKNCFAHYENIKPLSLDRANKIIEEYKTWYQIENIEDSIAYKNRWKADVDKGFQRVFPKRAKFDQRLRQEWLSKLEQKDKKWSSELEHKTLQRAR